jgi:hypothetical protein
MLLWETLRSFVIIIIIILLTYYLKELQYTCIAVNSAVCFDKRAFWKTSSWSKAVLFILQAECGHQNTPVLKNA